MEEFEEFDVGRVRFEVFFQEDVDAGFVQEGVVDGDHADAGFFVPAGLAAARDAAVHYVVGDEEEGLEELGEPAEGGGCLVLAGVEGLFEEEGGGVGDGEAAVEFASHGVVV